MGGDAGDGKELPVRIHPVLVGEEFRSIRYVSPITLPSAFNSHSTGA